ncbi:uncharacterized protein BDZ99DRAFT_520870 [Mytilinidion resinicola]|uniref:BTB domain-containing protein n=1 Tax=Mytilinidion resinicola TaxID=574789 RepID=A0A6A6YLU3_9PEZI|nr:uncharacterized protein BDZ99DRAFT_520870 [Mytilinidion resinicola]KAF2809519.1 hypothetical protein BDZ99DRAFT_520870 [Mytilinidion resinicola]
MVIEIPFVAPGGFKMPAAPTALGPDRRSLTFGQVAPMSPSAIPDRPFLSTEAPTAPDATPNSASVGAPESQPSEKPDKDKNSAMPSFMTMSGVLVQLKVGPEGQDSGSPVVYGAHRDLLAHHSGYFRALFKKGTEESGDLTVLLPDISPNTFNIFLDWFYFDRFPWQPRGELTAAIENLNLEIDLVDLYYMGEKYNIPKLRRDAISEFFFHFAKNNRKCVAVPTIMHAFRTRKLADGSPLHSLLIDVFCGRMGAASLNAQQDALPSDFMFRVLLQLQRTMPPLGEVFGTATAGHHICKYHEHKDTSDKCGHEGTMIRLHPYRTFVLLPPA